MGCTFLKPSNKHGETKHILGISGKHGVCTIVYISSSLASHKNFRCSGESKMIVFPHQFASVWAAKVSQKARKPTIRWCRCTHPEEKTTCQSWAIYNIGNVWGWKLIQCRFISDVVGYGRKKGEMIARLRLNMRRKHKIQWCMIMINPLTSCRKSSHPSTSASSNREKFLTARSQSNKRVWRIPNLGITQSRHIFWGKCWHSIWIGGVPFCTKRHVII